ncbi:hypothetical protein PRIPAC_93245 [Pristionchus pacificus]|uniref:Tyrosine phosphatase n=1 Tax=Pristionchus pacificus TaxID=54126 RepID=A0A2A6BQG3_PRIPA|nr:hypothetical protein PRIPAC_93245 [Pristionchus pacificus]|eukprot:PDM68108.1 tyrosine phosphatase [Pristionchus pacificus]
MQAASLATWLWGSIRGTQGPVDTPAAKFASPLNSSPIVNRDNGACSDRRIASMARFLESVEKKGPVGVLREFKKVDRFFDTTASHRAFNANMAKNRYSDVPCVDDSRIRLRLGATQHGDYIHANRVLPPFICTQEWMIDRNLSLGPTQHTVHDFWRMVFQERASSIVMLCRPVEEGKSKCTIYWPENVGEVCRLPTLTVTNEGKDAEDEFNTITFRVELNPKYDAASDCFGGEECRPLTVKLLRWIEWPDRSIPDQKSCLVPLRILDRVRGGTTIVHCSAGIGRTGSLIAIEMAMQRLKTGRYVAIDDIVRELRCLRSHAIQTDTQYLYIHKVLVEAALQLGAGNLSKSPRIRASPACMVPPSKDSLTLPSSARNAGNSFLKKCKSKSELF